MSDEAKLEEARSIGKDLIRTEKERKNIGKRIKTLKASLEEAMNGMSTMTLSIPGSGYSIEIGEKKIFYIKED